MADAPPKGALGKYKFDMHFDLESEDGMFDNYTPILKPFQACIEWEKIENERFMPRPMIGMSPEIDEILIRMDAIKKELKDLLKETRKKFNCDRIYYAHNRKFRYQFEVPNEFSKMFECDVEYYSTTRLRNTKRFMCADLSNLVSKLVNEEIVYKARISPLIRDMFERFYQNREHWSSAVKCIAEIDALCSLAVVSSGANMIKPIVHPMKREPRMKIV